MDPTTYQQLAARTECDQEAARCRMYLGDGTTRLQAIRLNHAIIGALGELGELASELERWLYYGQPLDKANWKAELGDTLWYLALACNALGLDLGEVMEANIRKLQTRYPSKYSNDLAAESNRNRAQEQEALKQPRCTLAEAAEELHQDLNEGREDKLAVGATDREIVVYYYEQSTNVYVPSSFYGYPVVLRNLGRVQADPHKRTKAQVLEARKHGPAGGCCSDWADMIRCTCLEEAEGTTGCSIGNDPNCDHPNGKH